MKYIYIYIHTHAHTHIYDICTCTGHPLPGGSPWAPVVPGRPPTSACPGRWKRAKRGGINQQHWDFPPFYDPKRVEHGDFLTFLWPELVWLMYVDVEISMTQMDWLMYVDVEGLFITYSLTILGMILTPVLGFSFLFSKTHTDVVRTRPALDSCFASPSFPHLPT